MTASISPDDAPKQNEYENDTLDAKHIRAIEKERRLLLQVALKGPLTILTTYTGTIVPHILTSFQFWSTILGYWLVRTLVRCNYFACEPLQRLLCLRTSAAITLPMTLLAATLPMQLLRLRTSAATTLPTTLCSNYDPYATTLPMTLCSDYFAYELLQQLLCLRVSVATMIPMQLLCLRTSAATTLPTSLCGNYFVYDTLQQLLCLRVSVATMIPMRLL
jgi:hypothetical protein